MKYITKGEPNIGSLSYKVDLTDNNIKILSNNTLLYNFVDLNLPSGLLWADRNIGAETPEETGLYFQWGDTQGYTAKQVGNGEGQKYFNSNFSDYKFYSTSGFTKYNGTDVKLVLDLEDDAAHVLMGGNWRIPTQNDFHELINNTDLYLVPESGDEINGSVTSFEPTSNPSIIVKWEQSTNGTIKGMKFYKKNDKQTYLFVPCGGGAGEGSIHYVGANGYLWSSSLDSQGVQRAWLFGFLDSYGGVFINTRYNGLPVRGVLSNN